MASQSFFDLECSNRDVKIVGGRFDITGASGAINSTKFGIGFSLEKLSGDGEYKLTLDKSYTGLLHVSTRHYEFSAGSIELQVVVTAENVAAATPTVTIQCVNTTNGSPANPPSGDDISFCLFLLDGEVS